MLIGTAGYAGYFICASIPVVCALVAGVGVAIVLFSEVNAAEVTQMPQGVPVNVNGENVFLTTTKDILQARNWKLTSWLKNGVNVATACETGPTWTFNQNNTITLTGPNTCYPASVSYYLYNSDQSIFIDLGDLVHWTVKELSPTKIVLSLIDNSTPANTLNVITYTGI